MGEIPTPIILLKDRLIGGEGGEDFLEEEKEGISFSSPEIPRGGNEEGKNFVGMVGGGREKFLLLHQRGKIWLGLWRGREKFLLLHQGGESSDRGGDFLKEEFSPTTEGGGVRRGREFFRERAS